MNIVANSPDHFRITSSVETEVIFEMRSEVPNEARPLATLRMSHRFLISVGGGRRGEVDR